MALLTIPTNEDAQPEAQVLFGHCEKLMGRVANAVRVAAHSPKAAQPLIGFLVAALRYEVTGVLELRIKTLVILKTSMLNGCDYCIGHNTALGRSIGFEDDVIAAVAGDYQNSDLFTPAEKAAIAWAEYLTERTYRQHPEAMPELKKHFTEAQIVEITMVSGFFNFWNRFVDGLQVDLETEHMVGNIKRSKVIDLDEYVAFMRDGWWREEVREAAE
ncbi:MAG: carboxymuconolactone decarboxylase family protein [Pseudomonadota bacterium]